MGTMGYMSPEQVRGEVVDHRSDIFSLGCVLYEMLAGHRAFSGRTPADTVAAVLTSDPPDLIRSGDPLPSVLQQVIRSCLEKDPAERFQSARDVGAALRDISEIGMRAALREREISPRPLYWMMAAFAALCVIVLVSGNVLERLRGVHTSRIDSIAVLPLENLSGDASQDYFAAGITDALITDLGQTAALRVISRSAVTRYKGQNKRSAEIARELRVDKLVEGSVLRSGDRVRITARLIDPATDAFVWSETFERQLVDVLAMQNEAARAIAKAVRGNLTGQEEASFAKIHPVRPDAYDSYLHGMFLASHHTKAGNLSAAEAFERAIAADPSFAPAYAASARVYGELSFFFTPELRTSLEEKAHVAVQKALSLDPNLADAYLVRGHLLWTPENHFPHERATQEIRRALALNSEGHLQLALIYNHTGLLDKALLESQRAAALDPSSADPLLQRGNALLLQGKYEEVLAVFRSIPREYFPTVVATQTAWALFLLGRTREALVTVEESSRLHPEDPGGWFAGMEGLLAAAAGDWRKSEEAIARALQKKSFGHFHHTAYWIACAYARMNKPQPTMEWLKQTAENGFPCYPLFARDANLNPLRKDVRFKAFLADIKIQWEHYQKTF
jgi:eukaryotic-like serine/threonine-protein kinase